MTIFATELGTPQGHTSLNHILLADSPHKRCQDGETVEGRGGGEEEAVERIGQNLKELSYLNYTTMCWDPGIMVSMVIGGG